MKRRLRRTTREAIDAGVFGVPTFRLQGALFRGADRVGAVVWGLDGGTIDDHLYASLLNRPISAIR